MKIIEEKQNSLLNRKEVKVLVEAASALSEDQARKIIIDNFKTQEDNIIVKKIGCKFGRNTFLIHAFIYNSKEDKEKVERKKKKKIKSEEEEKKGEEKEEIKEDEKKGMVKEEVK